MDFFYTGSVADAAVIVIAAHITAYIIYYGFPCSFNSVLIVARDATSRAKVGVSTFLFLSSFLPTPSLSFFPFSLFFLSRAFPRVGSHFFRVSDLRSSHCRFLSDSRLRATSFLSLFFFSLSPFFSLASSNLLPDSLPRNVASALPPRRIHLSATTTARFEYIPGMSRKYGKIRGKIQPVSHAPSSLRCIARRGPR